MCPRGNQVTLFWTCRGALLSLSPGALGGALSPALMSSSTLATIQGQWGVFLTVSLFVSGGRLPCQA